MTKNIFFVVFCITVFLSFISSVYALVFDPSISFSPQLDISRFAPYKLIVTTVPDQANVTSMTANVSVIGGDETGCWDYTVDGVCQSTSRDYTLNHISDNDNWASGNIYPDSIYPEIYFAPSNVTWANAPLNTPVRRGEYQIMHFNNPFSMVGDMSFWIEFNALAAAANSSNMEVYLVNKSQDITLFQSDWRSSPSIELVGTFLNDATYHHQHSVNSGHLLVPITTNTNGTVGLKNLDISGDFWIILYTQSPNVNRSWNLKYQPTSLCTNNNRWYKGNQADWSTALQAGCPDAHIHIARQSLNEDAIRISLSALYNDLQTYTIIDTEYFGDIPNLPPTGSSFLTPEAGTYSGNLVINWDPSTDANGSPLTYTIDLLNGDTSFNKNLITSTSNTTFTLDTTTLPYGEYSLLGTVCDDGAPLMVTPLCTAFELNHTFIVNNASPIYSLSNISITSTGNDNISKTGETISLSFTASGDTSIPIVNFYSGGYEVINAANLTEPMMNHWVASFIVDALDPTGEVTFDISEDYLDAQYFLTTDSSTMYIDNTAPLDPIADPISGTYIGAIAVAITSEGSSEIRYTTDDSPPTCSTGNVYAETIPVLVSSTIKAIGCDAIGNYSQIVTFTYVIEEEPTPTPTPTPTDTPTPTPTDTVTPTPTDTPVVTETPTVTPTATVTPTTTTTPSVTPTVTVTVTVVPTVTPTVPPVITNNPTPTVKPTSTITPVVTETPEVTITPTETIHPSLSITPTKTNSTMSDSPLLSLTFLDEKFNALISQKNGINYFSEIRFKIIGSDLKPLGNVNVTLRSDPVSGKTDENGMITFNNIPAGEHSVEVEYSGKTFTKAFTIDEPKSGEEIVAMSVIQVTVETEPPQEDQPISTTSFFCGASLIVILIVGILVLLKKNKTKDVNEPLKI